MREMVANVEMRGGLTIRRSDFSYWFWGILATAIVCQLCGSTSSCFVISFVFISFSYYQLWTWLATFSCYGLRYGVVHCKRVFRKTSIGNSTGTYERQRAIMTFASDLDHMSNGSCIRELHKGIGYWRCL
jgi:hypothetical protein